jgi:nucleoside-triphosphatase THEP1
LDKPNKRLIIVEGMPGSGKSTTATYISKILTERKISNRCILELEERHPLLLHGMKFTSFQIEQESNLFIEQLQIQFSKFVLDQLNSPYDVIIIESVFFQDAISVAHIMGMNETKLLNLSLTLQSILEPLSPILIYYYQKNVEDHWRFICSVRGNEWGPVSLQTDEDFKKASEEWTKSQSFVRAIVESWCIPKIIIENKNYQWNDYNRQFIDLLDKTMNSQEL